jgi:hypothetical protein
VAHPALENESEQAAGMLVAAAVAPPVQAGDPAVGVVDSPPVGHTAHGPVACPARET